MTILCFLSSPEHLNLAAIVSLAFDSHLTHEALTCQDSSSKAFPLGGRLNHVVLSSRVKVPYLHVIEVQLKVQIRSEVAPAFRAWRLDSRLHKRSKSPSHHQYGQYDAISCRELRSWSDLVWPCAAIWCYGYCPFHRLQPVLQQCTWRASTSHR